MARTAIKWVYTFNELDESAKEKARDWYRSGCDVFDHDCATDWLGEVCDALSIEIDCKKVYWSGFAHQGSGSSYSGDVSAAMLLAAFESSALESVAHIDLPAPPKLHRLVRKLLNDGDAIVRATCGESRGYGGEFHLHTDHDIDCYGLDETRHARIYAQLTALGEWAESVLDAINDWFYRALETEYDYQNSDAAIDETIECNEYEFDIDGNRV